MPFISDNSLAEVLIGVHIEQSPVPFIRDPASVSDLRDEEPDGIPLNALATFRLIQSHLQIQTDDLIRSVEVIVVEIIVHIPA